MESNHPCAKVNTQREPKELLYDTVEIKWGYFLLTQRHG